MRLTSPQPESLGKRAYAVAVLLFVFCCSGATCNQSFRSPFATVGPPSPEVLMPGATLDQIIAAVNQNAARIQNYQTTNATITIPGDAMMPALRGNIAASRPNNLRFQASTALTGPEVDLGSNDELFWFWVKRNDPPNVYFSRHDQFVGSAAQQLLPIEPRWLLDALGFMQFAPNDFHEGPVPHGANAVEIRSVIQSRIGTLSRNTVVDVMRALVLEQHIYDSRGTLLASAIARSHQFYPTLGVSLPQEIEISLPLAHMALSIDVGTVQINQLADNPALWQMPVLSGYQQMNLGTAQPNTISAMGAPGSNDWNTGAAPSWLGIEPPPGAVAASYENRPNASYVMPPVTPTSATTAPLVSTPAAPQFVSPTPQPQSLAPQTQSLPVGGVPIELNNR
jgi:hypothetical protein